MISVINKIEKQSNLIQSILNKQTNLYLNYFSTLIFNLFDKWKLQNPPPPPVFSSSSKLKKIKTFEDGVLVISMCLLRDGRLVTGGLNRIKIYRKYTYHSDISIEDRAVRSVCELRNGCLASSSYQKIKIYRIGEDECKRIHTLNTHTDSVNKVIELEDGRLCSCSEDNTIIIWDLNYQPIATLKTPHLVESVIEMNDYIISSTNHYHYDDGVRIWNKHTYQCIKLIPLIYCSGVSSLSKINESIIILGGFEELFVLDILSSQYQSFKNERLRKIESILVLRENQILIGNSKGEIMCYDSSSNQIITTQKLHKNGVNCIIRTEDNQIFSSSQDGNINIYG